MRACGIRPQVKPETSRFPRKELPHMPGSATTPGRVGARNNAPVHVAFRDSDHVGARDYLAFAAQWLAYALPYRRFAVILADANARLGADAVCYSFIVVNLHHLLFAGFYRRTKNQEFRTKHGIGNLCAVQSHLEIAQLKSSLSLWRAEQRRRNFAGTRHPVGPK